VDADYCICALPLTILKTMDTDFSPELKAVIAAAVYDSAYKIAWESRRSGSREQYLRGHFFLQQPVDTVWYPSASLFSETGVILGGYGLKTAPSSVSCRIRKLSLLPPATPLSCCIRAARRN